MQMSRECIKNTRAKILNLFGIALTLLGEQGPGDFVAKAVPSSGLGLAETEEEGTQGAEL